jgi:hypothetical protein
MTPTYITFQSIHFVLKAEKELLSNDLRFAIIPTPKHLSSECGMSIRITDSLDKLPDFIEVLQRSNINFEIHE